MVIYECRYIKNIFDALFIHEFRCLYNVYYCMDQPSKKMSFMANKKLLHCMVCSYIYKRANVRYKMFTVILDEKPLTI